jgi:hypothetical protein
MFAHFFQVHSILPPPPFPILSTCTPWWHHHSGLVYMDVNMQEPVEDRTTGLVVCWTYPLHSQTFPIFQVHSTEILPVNETYTSSNGSVTSEAFQIAIWQPTHLGNPADDWMELFAPVREEVLCDVRIKVVHSVLRLQGSTDIRAIHCNTKSWFWHSDILYMTQLLCSDIVHL